MGTHVVPAWYPRGTRPKICGTLGIQASRDSIFQRVGFLIPRVEVSSYKIKGENLEEFGSDVFLAGQPAIPILDANPTPGHAHMSTESRTTDKQNKTWEYLLSCVPTHTGLNIFPGPSGFSIARVEEGNSMGNSKGIRGNSRNSMDLLSAWSYKY